MAYAFLPCPDTKTLSFLPCLSLWFCPFPSSRRCWAADLYKHYKRTRRRLISSLLLKCCLYGSFIILNDLKNGLDHFFRQKGLYFFRLWYVVLFTTKKTVVVFFPTLASCIYFDRWNGNCFSCDKYLRVCFFFRQLPKDTFFFRLMTWRFVFL